MSLVEHARRELELCGQFAEDPEYSESLIRAVEAFASFGHSGESAAVAVQQLTALLTYRPLSPLTNDPADWIDQSAASGQPMWQNRRDSTAFSKDGGKTWYWLDEETVPPNIAREIKLRKARDKAQADLRKAEDEHNEFVNAILASAPDSYDGDAAAEAIAVDYVHDLETVLAHAVRTLEYLSLNLAVHSSDSTVDYGVFAANKREELLLLVRLGDGYNRSTHKHGDGAECYIGCPAFAITEAYLHVFNELEQGEVAIDTFDEENSIAKRVIEVRKMMLRRVFQRMLNEGYIYR